jgi:hypothetical protein
MANEIFRVMSMTPFVEGSRQYVRGFGNSLQEAIKVAKKYPFDQRWIELPSARATKTINNEIISGVLIPVKGS